MQIFITGATGLIGQALIQRLIKEKYAITALVRDVTRARQQLPAQIKLVTDLTELANFDQFDGVINLAGAPIFEQPWTAQRKRELFESRVLLTQQISHLINLSEKPPHFFISGSATGYYGNRPEQILTENSAPDNSFAAQLCQQWEAAALTANTRVCLLRTGIVLSRTGGALAKMLPIYRRGLGGKLGNGEQYWAWIALQDMIDGIYFLMLHHSAQGAFNFCAPNAIRNKDFNRQLSRQLKRPAFFTAPACLLKLALGERTALLLDNQLIQPTHLQQLGFSFHFPELAHFLKQELGNQ